MPNGTLGHGAATVLPTCRMWPAPNPPTVQVTKTSRRILAGVGLEAGRLDSGNRASLVAIGGVAGNADRADDVTNRGPDQHAAGVGHDPSLAGGRERGEEHRRLGRTCRERARAEPHAKRSPSLAVCDVEPHQAGLVLALECHEVPAGI